MALRMVEMVLPAGAQIDTDQLGESLTVLGSWTEPLDGGPRLLRVLVESDKAEPVIYELEKRFGGGEGFRLCIFSVEATLPHPEPQQVPAEDGTQAGDAPEDPHRIACAELVQKLSDSASINRQFLLTVVLSAIVAAIGLMRDNVAVIIGAMVIAPLLGPNMTLSLATTLGDGDLARRALRVTAVSLLIAAALAVGMGALLPFDPEAGQIVSRTDVALSDVVLALAAGCAGALAFTTGLSAALVGVMVAVALLPPLVSAGLLTGAGEWSEAGMAALLLATNVICVNLAGVGTFLWQGVRPRLWWDARRARRMVRVAGAIWAGLLAVLVALIVIANL